MLEKSSFISGVATNAVVVFTRGLRTVRTGRPALASSARAPARRDAPQYGENVTRNDDAGPRRGNLTYQTRDRDSRERDGFQSRSRPSVTGRDSGERFARPHFDRKDEVRRRDDAGPGRGDLTYRTRDRESRGRNGFDSRSRPSVTGRDSGDRFTRSRFDGKDGVRPRHAPPSRYSDTQDYRGGYDARSRSSRFDRKDEGQRRDAPPTRYSDNRDYQGGYNARPDRSFTSRPDRADRYSNAPESTARSRNPDAAAAHAARTVRRGKELVIKPSQRTDGSGVRLRYRPDAPPDMAKVTESRARSRLMNSAKTPLPPVSASDRRQVRVLKRLEINVRSLEKGKTRHMSKSIQDQAKKWRGSPVIQREGPVERRRADTRRTSTRADEYQEEDSNEGLPLVVKKHRAEQAKRDRATARETERADRAAWKADLEGIPLSGQVVNSPSAAASISQTSRLSPKPQPRKSPSGEFLTPPWSVPLPTTPHASSTPTNTHPTNLFAHYTTTNPPNPSQLSYASTFFTRQPPTFLLSSSKFRTLPRSSLPEICFIGRSNVGKSSLLNALVRRTAQKIAHTSSKPGRTVTMNAFGVCGSDDKSGVRLGKLGDGEADGHGEWVGRGCIVVLDMPGYGRASREEWGREIQKYLSQRKQLRRTFVLIDAEHGVKEADKQVLQILRQEGVSHQLVLTKIDKVAGVFPRSVLKSGSVNVGPEGVERLYENARGIVPELCRRILAEVRAEEEGDRSGKGRKTGMRVSEDVLVVSAEQDMPGVAGGAKVGIDGLRWAVLSAAGLECDEEGRRKVVEVEMASEDGEGSVWKDVAV